MNLPRNYVTYNKRRVIMPKSGEETRLKSPKTAARPTWNPQTRQENTTKMKIWKITTAKFKCTREHILGHDWLIIISWYWARNCARTKLRGEFRVLILQADFFMFILLISNHTVFLVQFGINLHLWVFQKAEIALAEAARAILTFWKTHSCKIIPNWTRNRMITYTKTPNKYVCLSAISCTVLTIKLEFCYINVSKNIQLFKDLFVS